MTDIANQRVSCPTCGAGYRWRAELVGKEVPCKQCDTHFIVPDQAGTGLTLDPVGSGGGYELASEALANEPVRKLAVEPIDGKCPVCNVKLREGAVVCMTCGFNLEEGNKVQTAVAEPADAEEENPDDPDQDSPYTKKQKRDEERAIAAINQHQWLDYKLPAILSVVGVLLAMINLVLVPSSDMYGMGLASSGEQRLGFAIWSSVNTLTSALLLFGALLANVAICGAAFGALGSVLLKVLAITLICRQTDILFVMTMDMLFELSIVGIVIGWGIYLGLYIALCMKMLELDAVEMRLVIGFVVVARLVGSFLITALIAALF